MLLAILSVVFHPLDLAAEGKVATGIAKKALNSHELKLVKVKKVIRYKQPLTDLDTSTAQITQESDLLTDGEWRSPALTDSDTIEGTDLLETAPGQRIEIR